MGVSMRMLVLAWGKILIPSGKFNGGKESGFLHKKL